MNMIAIPAAFRKEQRTDPRRQEVCSNHARHPHSPQGNHPSLDGTGIFLKASDQQAGSKKDLGLLHWMFDSLGHVKYCPKNWKICLAPRSVWHCQVAVPFVVLQEWLLILLPVFLMLLVIFWLLAIVFILCLCSAGNLIWSAGSWAWIRWTPIHLKSSSNPLSMPLPSHKDLAI